VTGKAHQRRIREREQISDMGDLFGRYWERIDIDIGKSEVRQVSIATAKKIIERYEWLGTMPAVIWACFGIFFEGECGGVVCYGPEYAENLGVWDKYGYTGKLILLSRGACVHWAHPHAASRLIRRSMSLLPDRFRVVTCTVDESAGEIGTIYQACGFDYVGIMADERRRALGTGHGKRAVIVNPDGSFVSQRQLGQKYGTQGVSTLRALGVPVVEVSMKGRYFGFRGDRREVASNRASIAHLIKPYPKRKTGSPEGA
jgi:hypothetical protein